MVLVRRAIIPFAVLESPVVLKARAPHPFAVLVEIFPPPLPTLSPLTVASPIVTRLPLAPERRIPSILLRLNTRSILSMVPRKLVPATVPLLPRRDQNDPEREAIGVCHVARPVASEMRILPRPGAPPVILTCPATSSRAHGVEVPIPIFPELP